MLFFCFSSKDRHCIVESILYHITNYAIPVWYDRYKMLMGDDRDYKNFVEGVSQNKYAVIILSQNAIDSACAKEEIELIAHKYAKKEITVFPIFYNIKAMDIPAEFGWMSKLVYKELDTSSDSLSACNHIVCRILLDELSKYEIHSFDAFIRKYENIHTYFYLVKLIRSYSSVTGSNHDAKISLLYAGCEYIMCHYRLDSIPQYYYFGVDFLFAQTRLHLPIDLRETLILERLFLLLFNSSVPGNLV